MYRVYLLILWLTWVTADSGDELSDFRRQKLTIFFHVIDRNNDSVLEEADYHQTVDSYYNECSWTLDEMKVATRQQTLVKMAWKTFPYGKNGELKSVTLDEYWAVMPSRVKHPDYQHKLKNFIEVAFQIIDVDEDNLMSLVEFSAILHEFRGVDSSATKRYFDALDTNGDNVLQVEEYVTAQMDFLAEDDETKPSKWLFGPLY